MYAVFSTTASGNASLSVNTSSALKACIKFIAVAVRLCVLKSHALKLFIVEYVDASSLCPAPSLSVFPIIVYNPLSCLAREVGAPVLHLSFTSSALKARHSGRLISCTLSEITMPQLLQMISPDSGSIMTVLPFAFPHIEHTIKVCIIVKENVLCYTINNMSIQVIQVYRVLAVIKLRYMLYINKFF